MGVVDVVRGGWPGGGEEVGVGLGENVHVVAKQVVVDWGDLVDCLES